MPPWRHLGNSKLSELVIMAKLKTLSSSTARDFLRVWLASCFFFFDASAQEKEPQLHPNPSVIIGNIDNRQPSDDPAVGRLLTAADLGCTGWISSIGAIVTAGHCNQAVKLQFNVPLSQPDGTINYPPNPADNYVVTFSDWHYVRGSKDSDWGVIRATPSQGLTPALRQKSFIRFSPLGTLVNNLKQLEIRVTGYGVDGPPPKWGNGGPKNAYNKTLQTATGPYIAIPSTSNSNPYPIPYTMCYLADTQPAASGSPVYINGTHASAGIHVASSGQIASCGQLVNIGTAIDQPDLLAALQAYPGKGFQPAISPQNTFFVDQGSLVSKQDGTILSPYQTISQAFAKAKQINGKALINLTAGHYADLPYTLQQSSQNDLTIIMPVGDVSYFPGLVSK